MPSLIAEGFRLIINTRDERGHRPHVHVVKAGTKCKVVLDATLAVYDVVGMSRRNIVRARDLVRNNFTHLVERWNEYNGES